VAVTLPAPATWEELSGGRLSDQPLFGLEPPSTTQLFRGAECRATGLFGLNNELVIIQNTMKLSQSQHGSMNVGLGRCVGRSEAEHAIGGVLMVTEHLQN
jgi:hypothetical protein